MLYFGTGFGRLWAYDTRSGALDFEDLDGCPIVSSPLVLRVGGRDLVVVGDKPYECGAGNGGKVWLVSGLDDLAAPNRKTSESLGGWVTSSPVPAGPDRFVIGADGAPCNSDEGPGNGRVLKFEVRTIGPDQYELKSVRWGGRDCVPKGIAGSFASDGDAVYWADTAGTLWGRRLADGLAPANWPSNGAIPLPEAIAGPGAIGFTNTEPAVANDLVYVTLRNLTIAGQEYDQQGNRIWLRGCSSDLPVSGCSETGAPGAVAAINRTTGRLAWSARLPAGPNPRSHPSVNTAPLVVQARGTLLFGDVQGNVHGYELTSPDGQGRPMNFLIDDACRAQSVLTLLKPGEKPARGKETWSQISGVGTDPMMASGSTGQPPLLIMGVNVAPPDSMSDEEKNENAWKFGRLIALRAGHTYNLRWDGPITINPTGPVTIGEPVTATGRVRLELTDKDLGALRSTHVPVNWFLLNDDWIENGPSYIRPVGETTLPPDLAPGAATEVTVSFELVETDPPEGVIMGLIDEPTVAFYGGWHGYLIRALSAALGRPPGCPLGLREVAEVRYATGGSGAVWKLSDNFGDTGYTKVDPADVAITLTAPATLPYVMNGEFPVRAHVTNRSDRELTVPVTIDVASGDLSWRVTAQNVTVAPGTTMTVERRVRMIHCSTAMQMTGEANPGGAAFAETDLTNNIARATTQTGTCTPVSTLTFVRGRGQSVVVPSDCVLNPDPTSLRPCLNYELYLDP